MFGIPDVATRKTHYAVQIPWVMGLIGTRSIDETVPGINDLVEHAEQRIRNGLIAYDAHADTADRPGNNAAQAAFEAHADDLGYALLLKRTLDDPLKATHDDIAARRGQHHSQRAGAVLVVPHHGRRWAYVHRAVCLLVLAGRNAS